MTVLLDGAIVYTQCRGVGLLRAMTNPGASNVDEVELVATHQSYDPDSPAWLEQVESLNTELQQDPRLRGQVRLKSTQQAGAKGSVTQLLIELHQSGALEAALTLITLWLHRDRRRRIVLRRHDAGGVTEITLDANALSDKSTAEIAKTLGRQL